jgi:hypothetical protein
MKKDSELPGLFSYRLMKETKTTLVERILDLERQIDATTKERVVETQPAQDRWYGVAYIGWGSWEQDVFFIEAFTPEDAIDLFEDAIKNGNFDGHGAHNLDDRCIFGQDERILVYEIAEHAEYTVKKKWEKI